MNELTSSFQMTLQPHTFERLESVSALNVHSRSTARKKIDWHLEYIGNKLAEYRKILDESDGDKKQEIKNEIEKQNQRKVEYEK